MKTNKLLLFSFAAAMMAGCADDDFVADNSLSSVEGLKGKLVEAGLLGMSRSGAEANTKAYSPDGRFVWMPSDVDGATGALTADRKNQRVGLCWTGRDLTETQYSAVTSLDQKVYTNYEFEHVGWLDANDAVRAPEVDPCEESVMTNGAYIVGEGRPEALFTGTTYTGGRWNAYYTGSDKGAYKSAGSENSTGVLSLGKGVFSTKNASIFQGEYLAYFPYTDKFTKGQILANVPTRFAIDDADDVWAASSESAFCVGYLKEYSGGSQAAGLSAKTFSGFLQIKLTNPLYSSVKYIKKIIVYSEGDRILYQSDLDASKLVASLSTGTGALDASQNYYYTNAETEKKSNALVIDLSTTGGPVEYISIGPDGSKDIVIPVLPQNVSDMQVILVDSDDKSYETAARNVSIEPNKATLYEVGLNVSFSDKYYAVDENSFLSAMNKIMTAGSTSDALDANEIKLLNDVELTMTDENYVGGNKYAGTLNSLFYDRNVTITTAQSCGAKLIVAPNTAMHIKVKTTSTLETPTLTVDVDVVVSGAGCCGNAPAKLSVGGRQDKTTHNTVVFTRNIENYGTLALGNDMTGNTDVTIKGKVTNKLDTYAVTRGKTTDAAKIYLLGAYGSENGDKKNTINISEVDNEGGIYSWPQSAAINGADVNADGSVNINPSHSLESTYTARVTHTTIGTLANKGEVEVGEGTQVDVTRALKNSEQTSLIKIVGTGKSVIDGRMDVKGTSSNVGTIDNTGSVNFNSSSLTNTGLFIDRTSGQLGGKPVNNGSSEGTTTKSYANDANVIYNTDLGVAGIYVAQVATDERMAQVLSDVVLYPSTVIVEILGSDDAYGIYNLSTYEKDLAGKDVKVNPTDEKQITFKAYTGSGATLVYDAKNFGHCVEVVKGTLCLTDGLLSTVNDLKVYDTATKLTILGANEGAGKRVDSTSKEVAVTIGHDLITDAEMSSTADLTVKNNFSANAKVDNFGKTLTVRNNLDVNKSVFTSGKNDGAGKEGVKDNGKFIVTGTVTVASDATFDSNCDGNTANNFTTSGITSFACKTTTTVPGTFTAAAGTCDREGLNGSNSYRATVNVGTLVIAGATTSTSWPTEIPK